ncbi:MAG: c-type cytochrome biogenesis protein CcsB [Desulfobacterales bacterium]|nr:c-type cytochrome biogenesis protein CcsB [Desulfobacterales bacterium]MDD4071126.1 c-type cytochrome biogenesis protein CcsB [Desulfobacterales bacterium]MDD4393531.1 c-type cytochrome biogenesis protein CcsB [Desulfobacterales bacterium]
MNSSHVLSLVTFTYAFSAIFYIVAWIFRKSVAGKLASLIAWVAVVGNFFGLILRWIESYQLGYGHAPLSNLYESLVFFACMIGAIYLVLEWKYKNRVVGAFAAPLAFLAMAYASLAPNINDRIQPLVPALKSNWLIAHVFACFLGYAAFAIAFGVSIMFLIKGRQSDKSGRLISHLPDTNILDELTYQMIMFGFLFLSIGIITGSVWANSAWGTYWSWDPKETWSLITWFIYATLLHARLMRGWHGKRIAWLSIFGFMAVLFTYFGVNLLPGLHSYGQF